MAPAFVVFRVLFTIHVYVIIMRVIVTLIIYVGAFLEDRCILLCFNRLITSLYFFEIRHLVLLLLLVGLQ